MASEKTIRNEIMREFATRLDMRLWPSQVGMARYEDSKTGQEKMVRFGVVGQADLTGVLPGGVRLEIETKAPGKKQTEQQKNYQRMIEQFDGVYILAYSVDDVWEVLKEYLK